MVEINNQRKFLDMLAWSEGTDNGRQKTRNHGYDVIVAESYLLITPITLGNLSRQLQKNLTNMGWICLPAFPVGGCLPQAAWPAGGILSEKSGCQYCSRLRSVAFTYD